MRGQMQIKQFMDRQDRPKHYDLTTLLSATSNAEERIVGRMCVAATRRSDEQDWHMPIWGGAVCWYLQEEGSSHVKGKAKKLKALYVDSIRGVKSGFTFVNPQGIGSGQP